MKSPTSNANIFVAEWGCLKTADFTTFHPSVSCPLAIRVLLRHAAAFLVPWLMLITIQSSGRAFHFFKTYSNSSQSQVVVADVCLWIYEEKDAEGVLSFGLTLQLLSVNSRIKKHFCVFVCLLFLWIRKRSFPRFTRNWLYLPRNNLFTHGLSSYVLVHVTESPFYYSN